MSIRLDRSLFAAIFGAVLAAMVGWSFLVYGFGRPLITKSYQLLLVLRGEVAASDAVIVYLDEVSFRELKQPLNAAWDRSLHARLIERLTKAGARAVVFDVVFADPSAKGAEADIDLAQAIKTNGRVILAADNERIGPKTKKIFPP